VGGQEPEEEFPWDGTSPDPSPSISGCTTRSPLPIHACPHPACPHAHTSHTPSPNCLSTPLARLCWKEEEEEDSARAASPFLGIPTLALWRGAGLLYHRHGPPHACYQTGNNLLSCSASTSVFVPPPPVGPPYLLPTALVRHSLADPTFTMADNFDMLDCHCGPDLPCVTFALLFSFIATFLTLHYYPTPTFIWPIVRICPLPGYSLPAHYYLPLPLQWMPHMGGCLGGLLQLVPLDRRSFQASVHTADSELCKCL